MFYYRWDSPHTCNLLLFSEHSDSRNSTGPTGNSQLTFHNLNQYNLKHKYTYMYVNYTGLEQTTEGQIAALTTGPPDIVPTKYKQNFILTKTRKLIKFNIWPCRSTYFN